MAGARIILADRRLDGVLEILHDWAAQGLVEPFAWIRAGEEHGVAVDDSGRMTGGSLDVLAAGAAARGGAVCFAALQLASGTDGLDEATRLHDSAVPTAQRITGVIGASSLERYFVTVLLEGAREGVPAVALHDWRNVALAAQEAAAPGAAVTHLTARDGAETIARHAAGALASALGMWRGDLAPVDVPRAPGAYAAVARSYSRQIDGSDAEAALREHVLRTDEALPLPRTTAGTVYVEDTGLASREMAQRFWQRHAHVLKSGRESAPPPQAAKNMNWLDALRMFFGFLWASIKNAPRAWAMRLVHEVKTTVARKVMEVTFGGDDSQYRVVVGGVLPDGSPASLEARRDAADRAAANLAAASGTHHAGHEDLSSVWKDYAAAAFTLADGGVRAAELPPVEIGGRVGVMRSRDDIVPTPATTFRGFPAELHGYLPTAPVPAFDALAVHETEARLAGLASNANIGRNAAKALEVFRTWKQQHASSFASRFGVHIAHAHVQCTQEIGEIVQRLQHASTDDLDQETTAQQKRVARALKWLLIGWLVLSAAAVALYLLELLILSPLVLAITLVSLLIAWGTIAMIVFLRGQRRLFQLLNQRRQAGAQAEVDQKNLLHALRDLRRLTDAYSQFLRWSELIGLVLADPFGTADEQTARAGHDPRRMTPSHRLGVLQPEAEVLEIAGEELRRGVFAAGWLDEPWSALIDGAHARLGARGVEFRDAPEHLYRQLGAGPDTVLPVLRDHIHAHGTDSGVGAATWQRSLALLADAQFAHVRASVSSRVATDAGSESIDSFEGGLERAEQEPGMRAPFSPSAFVATADADSASRVATTKAQTVRRGLSTFVLVQQWSEPVDHHTFAALRSEPVHAPDRFGVRDEGSPSRVSEEPARQFDFGGL